MKNNDYQYVLSMLDDDVVHEFVSYIVSRELLSPRKTPITVEEIQHELSHTNMKSIIRKLVKERKKDVLEENQNRKTGKELNNVIKKRHLASPDSSLLFFRFLVKLLLS